MIFYHGVAGMMLEAANRLLRGRHGLISFAAPESMALAAELCSTFVLDCGAYSVWKSGAELSMAGYVAWVEKWRRHPGFDWCIIPDIIEGEAAENDALIENWMLPPAISVPVWHLHESLDRLRRLCEQWPRVALGSTGEFAHPASDRWWDRMAEAMNAICDAEGRPPCKLHGLRMMNPTIFSHVPFASVDSSQVARNLGYDKRWDDHMYLRGLSKGARAMVLAERIEGHAAASVWADRDRQMNFALLG